jgi:AcrR family transcriptional regulator
VGTNQQATSRRDRILVSAEAEFAVHGLVGARVERIAAAASVNKQLLFHYFGSKAGLYQAVSDSVFNRYSLDAPPNSTPSEQLRELVRQLVRAGLGHRRLLPDQWRSKAVSALVRVIEHGQRSGHYRDDADPSAVAQVVVAASIGISPTEAGSKHQAAAEPKFADSLAQMVIDHCTWR